MAAKLRNRQLESRNGRGDLAPAEEAYWLRKETGHYFGFYKPKKGAGTWWARVYFPDTRTMKRQALGTADDFSDANGATILDFKQAQAAAAKWFQACDEEAIRVAGGEPAQEGPFTVTEALNAYFEDCRRRGVKGVARDELRAVNWLTPELGPLEVKKLTRRRLELWLAAVAESPRRKRAKKELPTDTPAPAPRNFKVPRPAKEEPLPPAPPATEDEKRARRDTANRILTVLKAALNFALHRRLVNGISGEAWRDVKPYRGTTKARVRFLSVQDQVRLINACPEDFRRLVHGALLTGGRYGELARAQVQDFDATGGTLFLVGKGTGEGKPRRVVLTDEGQAFFSGLTAGRGAEDLIFLRGPEIKRRKHLERGQAWGHSEQGRLIDAACTKAGLDPVTFHELRHSYASMLVNAGCPLPYVAAQLGHTDTRMVEKHYGHLAPNALADSVRALMPELGLVGAPKVEPLRVAGTGK